MVSKKGKKSPFDTVTTKLKGIDEVLFGGKDTTRIAFLVVVSGPGTGNMHQIEPGRQFLIGRSKEVDVVVEDNLASRIHARIGEEDGEVYVLDCSTNGTLVNGEQISERVLKDGDKIQIGEATILNFTHQDQLDRSFHERAHRSSLKDMLTDSYNRQYFSYSLTVEFSHHKRHNRPLSLVLIDVDGFKKINALHGLLAGDFLLKRLSREISRTIRHENTLCRYGGDEFVIICRECDTKGALALCKRFFAHIKTVDFDWEEKKLSVKMSVGFATWFDNNLTSPVELFNRAKELLSEAKSAGGNRIVYDPEGP